MPMGFARQWRRSPAPCPCMCYLKMGDREKAKGSFVTAVSMGEEGNPEHEAARGKASAMLAILEQAEK